MVKVYCKNELVCLLLCSHSTQFENIVNFYCQTLEKVAIKFVSYSVLARCFMKLSKHQV